MSIDALMDWGGSPLKFPGNAPRELDLDHYCDTTWSNAIEFTNTPDDSPIDISGYEFSLTIKRNTHNKKVVKELSLGDGLYVVGADNNILLIYTLIDLPSGIYVYDLIGTTETGEVIPYLKGKIKLEENV